MMKPRSSDWNIGLMGTEKRDHVDGKIQSFNDLEIVKRLILRR